jgi:hypothetical protein
MLTGKLEFDEFYEVGAVVLVEYDLAGGKPANAIARGHYRLGLQGVLIGLFALLLLLVAGVTGLKAALSFVFAAMVLWKLYFPLLLRGYPPIGTGLAVVALLTAVITFSVGGSTAGGCRPSAARCSGCCSPAAWRSGSPVPFISTGRCAPSPKPCSTRVTTTCASPTSSSPLRGP